VGSEIARGEASNVRAAIELIGDLMIAAAIVGFVLFAVAMVKPSLIWAGDSPEPLVASPLAAPRKTAQAQPLAAEITVSPQEPETIPAVSENLPIDEAGASQGPITRVRIPRISLDAEVVRARFLDRDEGSWEIPAFKVGHAEFTSPAGSRGNTVLIGHVASIGAGDVFRNLDRMRVGDDLTLVTPDRTYQYVAVDVRRVPRNDVSVLAATDLPFVSLITCAGVWLPHVNDYTERLVVRAALVGLPT
jgi:LPXTG-site transpeptidase (sortase) family protein